MNDFGLNLRIEWLADLIRERPAIDCLQLIADNWLSPGPHHKKLENLRQDYKISFHCVGMNLAGFDDLNFDYIQNIKNLMLKYEPCHVSDHLAVQKHQGICYHDLLPFEMNAESLQRISQRVETVQETLNKNLLLENLSSYSTFEKSTYSEAFFLKKLVELTECHLLLDVNNIYVNQINKISDFSDYFEWIPFESVKEIHVAGGEWLEETFVDTHGCIVSDDVLELLFKVEKMCPNPTILYERDQHIPPLQEAVEEVERIQFKLTKKTTLDISRQNPSLTESNSQSR